MEHDIIEYAIASVAIRLSLALIGGFCFWMGGVNLWVIIGVSFWYFMLTGSIHKLLFNLDNMKEQ